MVAVVLEQRSELTDDIPLLVGLLLEIVQVAIVSARILPRGNKSARIVKQSSERKAVDRRV